MEKPQKLRELSDEELKQKERELKRQLFNVRFAVATGQQDNTALIGQLKRQIAQVKTILRERQLQKERTQ
jgi:large subunit ribosomal protein L29